MSDARRAIAVIGAGLAGATAARALADDGASVTVFDKGRAPGGRAATRLHDTAEFDHGAQYFTARDARFLTRVKQWERDAVIAPWNARFTRNGAVDNSIENDPRYVGVPRMSTICDASLNGLDVRTATRVAAIEGRPHAWRLRLSDGLTEGPFSAVVVTAPPKQSVSLLTPVAPAIARKAKQVHMRPCWALMAEFDREIESDFDATAFDSGPISWIARNATKPGRAAVERWVAHASHDWTIEHLNEPRETAANALTDALCQILQTDDRPTSAVAHRWRYAWVENPIGATTLLDDSRSIALAADWLLGPRIECAYISGLEAAQALITHAATKA